VSNLLEQVALLESENEAVQEEVDDYLKKRHARDQSGIAWLIIIAFVVCIACIFGFIFFNLDPVSGCIPSETIPCEFQWEAPAKFLTSIVSSILLPIVTLVLGYYFGTEQKAK
jgi:hypothetical protein